MKSNTEWKIGDKVETVGRILRDGIVRQILSSGPIAVMVIEWPGGILEPRTSRTLRKR